MVAAPERYIKKPAKYVLGDIKSVKILDQSFNAKSFNIREFANRSFGVYIENNDGYDIEWRASSDVATDAMKYIFHPTQKIIKNKDGTLTIKFHANGLREIAWHLFTWGGKIVPTQPVELIN